MMITVTTTYLALRQRRPQRQPTDADQTAVKPFQRHMSPVHWLSLQAEPYIVHTHDAFSNIIIITRFAVVGDNFLPITI